MALQETSMQTPLSVNFEIIFFQSLFPNPVLSAAHMLVVKEVPPRG